MTDCDNNTMRLLLGWALLSAATAFVVGCAVWKVIFR